MNQKQNKWINVGDRVVVIAGNEKGQSGKVVARTDSSVVIEGLNMRTKHVKPKQRMQKGIVKMEGPIHVSNARLCDDEGKPVKLKVAVDQEGKRQLVYRKNGKDIVYRDVKKGKN